MRTIIFLWFLAFANIMLPNSAHANNQTSNIINIADEICTLTGHKDADYKFLLRQKNQWDCSEDKFSKATDYLWLMADISDVQKQFSDPVIRMRTSRHGDVQWVRHFTDGEIITENITLEQMNDKWRTPYAIAVDISDNKGRKAQSIAIGIEKPWDPQNWQGIEILERDNDIALNNRNNQFNALFSGLLFAPILLNLVIFVIIKQRFIIYHSLMVVGIMVNHISWSGQLFDIIPSATMADRSIISHIALALVGFAASMLIRSICDPQKLGAFCSKLLIIASASCLIITILLMIVSPAWPLIGSQIFHIFFVIMTVSALSSLVYASLRGDKLAMLQLVGLSLAIIISIIRVVRALGIWPDAPIMDWEFNVAVMLELLTISYVVALRAYQLRKSRDIAIQESKIMSQLAKRDPLTQLYNRRGFMEQYDKIAALSEKRAINRALITLDIDLFKNINDEYGHDVGDKVLEQIGVLLTQSCRDGDICARLGGEEFALIISSPKINGIDAFANRLLKTIGSHEFSTENIKIGTVTVSMGIIAMDMGQEKDFNIYYKAADEALYKAKKAGRNCIHYGEWPNMQKNEDDAHLSAHKKSGDEHIPALS